MLAGAKRQSAPVTVRISLPSGGKLSLSKAAHNPGNTQVYPSSVSFDEKGIVVEGFPGIYIQLRGFLRQRLEFQYVSGVLNMGERYSVVQGCLYTRTKQSTYKRVIIHSLEYTVEYQHHEMFGKPLEVDVMGYNYLVYWSPTRSIMVAREEAEWLYSRGSLQDRQQYRVHEPVIGAQDESAEISSVTGSVENLPVIRGTPIFESELEAVEVVDNPHPGAHWRLPPQMTLEEIRRLVELGRRSGGQLAICQK